MIKVIHSITCISAQTCCLTLLNVKQTPCIPLYLSSVLAPELIIFAPSTLAYFGFFVVRLKLYLINGKTLLFSKWRRLLDSGDAV